MSNYCYYLAMRDEKDAINPINKFYFTKSFGSASNFEKVIQSVSPIHAVSEICGVKKYWK